MLIRLISVMVVIATICSASAAQARPTKELSETKRIALAIHSICDALTLEGAAYADALPPPIPPSHPQFAEYSQRVTDGVAAKIQGDCQSLASTPVLPRMIDHLNDQGDRLMAMWTLVPQGTCAVFNMQYKSVLARAEMARDRLKTMPDYSSWEQAAPSYVQQLNDYCAFSQTERDSRNMSAPMLFALPKLTERAAYLAAKKSYRIGSTGISGLRGAEGGRWVQVDANSVSVPGESRPIGVSIRVKDDGALYVDLGPGHANPPPALTEAPLKTGVRAVAMVTRPGDTITPLQRVSRSDGLVTYKLPSNVLAAWLDSSTKDVRALFTVTFTDETTPQVVKVGTSGATFAMRGEKLRREISYAKAPPFMSSTAPQ